MPLFDSHCHFDFEVFGNLSDQQALWHQCRQQGVEALLVPGVSPEQWSRAEVLVQSLSTLYMAAGIHPWWIDSVFDQGIPTKVLECLHDYLCKPYCVALGECGLDGCLSTPMSQQVIVFEQQVQIACDHQLPLIVHARKTHQEMLSLLKRYRPRAGGVIHGFTGSIELAQSYWRLGFRLGVGGSITYPRAKKTLATIKNMPLDALILETDAPDMPLQGYQGRPNSPLQLPLIAQSLSQLREEPYEQMIQAIWNNTCRLFSLSIKSCS